MLSEVLQKCLEISEDDNQVKLIRLHANSVLLSIALLTSNHMIIIVH